MPVRSEYYQVGVGAGYYPALLAYPEHLRRGLRRHPHGLVERDAEHLYGVADGGVHRKGTAGERAVRQPDRAVL